MRLKNKFVFIIITTITISLNSCYFWNSTSETVKVRKYHGYVELELTHKSKMGGVFYNIHAGKIEAGNSTTLHPEWIYIKNNSSRIEGKDILLETFKADSASDLDFSKSKNLGYIEIDSNTINIEIQRPQYKGNDVSGYSSYEHNGTYKYKILTDTISTKDQLNYYLNGLTIEEYIKKFGNDF